MSTLHICSDMSTLFLPKTEDETLFLGHYQRKEGRSKFNKIYEFEFQLFNQKVQMAFTSVSGHLLSLDFVGSFKSWSAVDPVALFDAPIVKFCPPDFENIKRTLEEETRKCRHLIIWTDCDRYRIFLQNLYRL